MKQIQTIVNTVLACALIFLLIVIGLPNFSVKAATATPPPPTTEPAQPSACDASRTVQVSGTAVVNVKPDRALIQLGVQSNGRSAKEAQEKNSATINKVTKALKTLGIESKDIATDWYTIEPLYEDYDSLYIKGYRIYNIIEVTVRDVDKANDVDRGRVPGGREPGGECGFLHQRTAEVPRPGAEMAMKAASEKAKALAQTAGADTELRAEHQRKYFILFQWLGLVVVGMETTRTMWTQNAVQNVAPSGGETPPQKTAPSAQA